MSETTTLEALDERTKTLVREFHDHRREDDKHFDDVFTLIKRVEITQAKSGVVIAGIVICAQIFIGAWIKGMF